MTTSYWNAEDAGCGSLVVGLKRQIGRIGEGDLLQVTAHNEGAPVYLPAWCRVSGHTLVKAEHPVYVLRKEAE